MKAIIDGLRFNTETAKFIGLWYNDLGIEDFDYVEEALYKTPRGGRYFLAGYGGARTEYAECHGQETFYGHRIQPLSPDEAMEWLQYHKLTGELETEFPSQIQDA